MKVIFEPLVLTVILEAIAAYGIGIRDRRNQYLILLTNCITNPLLVLTSLFVFVKFFGSETGMWLTYLVLEPVVIYAEYGIYLAKMETKLHPFTVSLILNLVSIIGGNLWRILF